MMRSTFYLLLVLTAIISAGCSKSLVQEINLAGSWHYRLDPDSVGENQHWATASFDKTITLPGTLDDAGIGQPLALAPKMDNATLTALHRKHDYVGASWFQRQVDIPRDWKGKHIVLELERVMWESAVWVDGKKVDVQESLVAPHRFDLSAYLSPGSHTLSIRIDNTNKYPDINVYSKTYPDKEMKGMAHAYTNHTQVKWNGILGYLRLRASNQARLQDIQVYPNVSRSTVKVVARPVLSPDFTGFLDYKLLDPSGKEVASASKQALKEVLAGDTLAFNISLDKPDLWHEFNPKLYRLLLSLRDEQGVVDEKELRFGFAQVSRQGEVLQLNNTRIFLRGNLECVIFPLTGYPPTAKADWAQLISRAKDYGLNHLRFHSYCPPKAAFEAADEAGFYLQTELPHWSLNVGQDPGTNRFLVAEADRLLKEYGNHPSFILLSLGNELQGDTTWMIDLVDKLKQQDKRHLYMATTFSFQKGFGSMPRSNDDYFVTQWTDDGWVRGQKIFNDQSPGFDKDYADNIRRIQVPVISHEIGQYSVFPDLTEIAKYTGNLAPLNFIAIKNAMQEKGLLDLADDYLRATGEFATLLYKEEIERALKTQGFDGFQLLQLQDFPGQGTALVGLLNAFWESKGAVSGKEFRQFNSELVPLARFKKATYTNDETFRASIEVANFYKVLSGQRVVVRLKDKQKVLAQQVFASASLPVGNGIRIGDFSWDLSAVDQATQLVLEASLEGTEYRNQWRIWVYPATLPPAPGEVLVTASFQEAEQALKQGRKVLLNPDLNQIKGVDGIFLPVFWSPVHFPNQPGTMGVLVDTTHRAFRHFPTAFHSDWQWWDLSVNAKTVQFDSLQVSPLVRMIDNFLTNRNMATVFEAKVGTGKLIFSSIDLKKELENRPVARQLKYSLLEYMKSADFEPAQELDYAALKKVIYAEQGTKARKYDLYK